MRSVILDCLVLLFLITSASCTKEEDNRNSSGGASYTPPVLDGGSTYLTFDDSLSIKWYAENLERKADGNKLSLKATGRNSSLFELETINLTGDSAVIVGGTSGYLLFTNFRGETFDTRIGGGGSVFFNRFDEERIEATFLFPTVQSISNNFMELNNGKFGFNLPDMASFLMYDIFNFSDYLFVQKPHSFGNGSTTYISGKKDGYSVEVSSPGSNLVSQGSVNYSGNAGDGFQFDIDYGKLTEAGNFTVKSRFLRNGQVIDSASDSGQILPIFGTYKLYPLNGAPANNSTMVISPVAQPSTKYYTVSGVFNKTITFEDDGTGLIECYDNFQYLGQTVISIYFYDNGPNEIHMAVHSASFSYFYTLLRQ